MIELSEGALDAIMAGDTVESPIFQILEYKKLISSHRGERYRLLLSDGRRINSFVMLSIHLNHMVGTDLTELTVCQIDRYAITNINAGKPNCRRVIIILSLDVKVPGSKVGKKIGNPLQLDTSAEPEKAPAPEDKPQPVAATPSIVQKRRLDETISSNSNMTSTSIAALSSYQNRWVIKARVNKKSPVTTWKSNLRGETKLFLMDLEDESGEIRCSALNKQCDKFYDMIEVGKVYYISRCTLKPHNKQFSTLKNDYEMTMNNNSEVVVWRDDVDDVSMNSHDIRPRSEVKTRYKKDIIGMMFFIILSLGFSFLFLSIRS